MLFHQLPNNVEEADEFFRNYQENILKPRAAKSLELIQTISETLVAGIAALYEEVQAKELEEKESEAALLNVRRKHAAMRKRIKEDGVKDREEADQKLLQLESVCESLEKEKNALSMQLQDKILEERKNPVKLSIGSLRVAKSLYANFMKFNLKISDEGNKIVLTFPNKNDTATITVAFDKATMKVIDPQGEVRSFAQELEDDGNVALFLFKIQRLAYNMDQK